MKTYLVTGAAGFIGANFLKYILNKYRDIFVVVLDKLTYAGNLKNIENELKDKRVEFVKGDICNNELVENIFSIVIMLRKENAKQAIRLEVSKEYWQNNKRIGDTIYVKLPQDKIFLLDK